MKWNVPDQVSMVEKLIPPPPGEVLDMVLDTDTYNEIDDQFALAYSLLSPERIKVHAVYAAPFYAPGCNTKSDSPGDGMEKSYQEILRLLQVMHHPVDDFAFRGSDHFMTGADVPVDSPAARDLIKRAMSQPDGKTLYVAAIGAPTNVASAILMEPAIVKKIMVVWLGGDPIRFPGTMEFNLMQDLHSVRVLLDCGVPLVMIPCLGVSSHLLASAADMHSYLDGANTLCDTLSELFCAYTDDHFIWAKEIWDVSVIAWLIQPSWVPTSLLHTPHLTDDCNWAPDDRRHFCREAYFCFRNAIFKDLFTKLRKFQG